MHSTRTRRNSPKLTLFMKKRRKIFHRPEIHPEKIAFFSANSRFTWTRISGFVKSSTHVSAMAFAAIRVYFWASGVPESRWKSRVWFMTGSPMQKHGWMLGTASDTFPMSVDPARPGTWSGKITPTMVKNKYHNMQFTKTDGKSQVTKVYYIIVL